MIDFKLNRFVLVYIYTFAYEAIGENEGNSFVKNLMKAENRSVISLK